MRTQRELSSLSPLHRASVALHASIQISHKRNRSLLSSTAKQVLSTPKNSSQMTAFIESHDSQSRTSGIVRALNNFVIPEKNHKLEHLISKQFEDRRWRHLSLIKKYEVWQEKLYENIANNQKLVIKRWESFVAASEKEVNRVIDSLNDDELLKSEIDVVHAAFENIQNHARRRKEEAKSLFNSFEGLENERKKKSEEYCKALKAEMVTVAYLLEYEISEIINKYLLGIFEFSDLELEKFNEVNEKNLSLTENFTQVYTEKMNEKMDKWRIIHHSNLISSFIAHLSSRKFLNPEERENIFYQMRETQTQIYNLRTSICREVCENDLKDFTQALIDSKLDQLSTANDLAQEKFDKLVQDLLNLQQVVFKELDELFDVNKEKILYTNAYDKDRLLEIINNELLSLVDQRKAEWQDLTKKTLKFLDENDARSQEVAINLLNFVKSIAQVSDEQQKRMKDEELKYNNDLAKRGDLLDENVEKIEEKFNKKVEDLKRTITLNDLEKALQDCIAVLEEIAQENRRYTEDVSDSISKHSSRLSSSYFIYLTKILEKFGIFSYEKKEEIIALIRSKKIESNKLKTPEEAKRRMSSVKEIQEIKVIVEVEEIEILGKKWVVHTPLVDISKDLLITDEDREKEAAKRLKEEERKREEERKMLEEQQKREEQKKNKGKPPVKVEETKKEEPSLLLVPETEQEEDNRPIDPLGNLCLLDSLLISSSYFSTILLNLQNNFSLFISTSENSALSLSKSSDSQLLNSTRDELDEKLRFLWPRKGKLEVNEFSNRSLEIKRHHNRWERFIAELTPKKESSSKEFLDCSKEVNDLLLKYKKEQDLVRSQLPKSTSIAEFQGLIRKNKDLEMNLFHKASEIIEKLEELANNLPEKLVNSCEEYLNNLILFEKGGDFDEKEVEYYRAKAKIICDSILNEAMKRKEGLETLKKKFENDRLEPVRLFEKEYGNALEGLAAKEGIGKKYGAPKRSAQEKIRAEMTKCEKAQEGIDGILEAILQVYSEFRQKLAEKNEKGFVLRDPSYCVNLRKLMISFRICAQKYGNHISAFKDENLPNIKSLTWREDQSGILASIEEVNLEASRLEYLYEPLMELGVNKTPGNFLQKISEIEKNARDESLKLYSGKALPDAVDRYYKLMKYYAEEFRSTRSKFLRESCLKLQDQLTPITSCTFQSLHLSFEYQFEDLDSKAQSKFDSFYKPEQALRLLHSKSLRPNLSNPSCTSELDSLNSSELDRYERVKSYTEDLLSEYIRSSREISENFRVKLQNNSETLLYLFDVFFIYDDFNYVPGDEAPEVKRSHIKQLMTKKKIGKAQDLTDPRGKKKTWTSLSFLTYAVNSEPPPPDIPACLSYKNEGQKLVINGRNKVHKEFANLFKGKVQERLESFRKVLKDEESWIGKWKEDVESLRKKND